MRYINQNIRKKHYFENSVPRTINEVIFDDCAKKKN